MPEQFISTTRLPELTQQLASGNPMSPIYISPEDALRVTLMNIHATAEFTFSGRLLRTDGMTIPLLQVLRVTRDGSAAPTVIDLAEGYLLSGAVIPSQEVPQRGECYGQIALVRGAHLTIPPFAILSTGYVSSLQPLTWPWGARNESVLEQPGRQEVFTVAVGPGAYPTITVPARRAWVVRSMAVSMTTDATAGNRILQFVVLRGPDLVIAVQSPVSQPPGVTWSYAFAGGMVPGATTGGTHEIVGIPRDLTLHPGWTVSLGAIGGAAADLFSTFTIVVESFQYWGVGL